MFVYLGIFIQMKRILENIGVNMTPEMFESIWQIAEEKDPQGKKEVTIPNK